MLYIFMGPSCSGKSAAAEELKKLISAEIYSGKDYLRMSKNENEAWDIFYTKLVNASMNKDTNSENIIYIITDKSNLSKLEEISNVVTVKFLATDEIIKLRFAKRMNGNLPKPIEIMLNRQLDDWKNMSANLYIDTSFQQPDEIAKNIYESSFNLYF